MYSSQTGMLLPEYCRQGRKFEYITESYVSSPPAAYIINSQGLTFTLGFNLQQLRDSPHGHYAFNILVDGKETGEFATHIEKRNGKVRIFTSSSWKIWNGRCFI
jgi:hypothetical protein